MTDRARTLNARYGKGMARHEAENSGVAIKIREATKGGGTQKPVKETVSTFRCQDQRQDEGGSVMG